MRNIFLEHLRSVQETYWQHMCFALCFGLLMLIGGVACIIHAFFPFLFMQTGTNCLMKALTSWLMRKPTIKDSRLIDLAQMIQQKT